MKTLVTGGTGFVGSHLVRALLERGHEVAVLARAPRAPQPALAGVGSDIERLAGDLADPAAVARAVAGREVVFHVAGAYSLWSALHEELHRTNVVGTRNVVEACLRAGARLVKTGSCAPYCGTRAPVVCDEEGATAHDGAGGDEDGDGQGEGDPPGVDRYASFHVVAMALAEREVLKGVARGLWAVQLHPGLVFGERDVHHHTSWVLALQARGGLFARRLDSPGGVNVADIRDVVAAHLLALERGRPGESYLIGAENLTNATLNDLAADVVGAPRPLLRATLPRLPLLAFGAVEEVRGRLRGDDRRNRLGMNLRMAEYASLHWWFTHAKAARDLGYRPGPVRPALERAWAWLREERGRRAAGRGAGEPTPGGA